MNNKRLAILLPMLVVLTMLASLVTPSPVLAAGEPPPPPGEKSPKAPAAAPVKPAPPASDSSFTAETPVEAPDGAASASPVALSVDAIAQADAVLVGPSGNPLPMAASDTVNVLLAPDAYFKGSGGGECVAGFCHYPSIALALANFFSHNGSGTIYANGLVEPGAVNVINNGPFNLSKLTGLAWDGTTNYSPKLTGGALTITNMLKGFTLDGFYIGQGIYAHDNAGTLRLQNLWVTNTAGTGIFVEKHNGNIDLFNVTVASATGIGGFGTPTYGDGAYLDNCKWNFTTLKCDNSGNVTIGNSAFNGNKQHGLYVYTSGSALLERVEGVGNNSIGPIDGNYLKVGKGATVRDSRFNGTVALANGLGIYGAGAVSLQNVEARGNTTNGIVVVVPNDITINGGFFTGNTNYGLKAQSTGGNITLNNLRSTSNPTGVLVNNSTSASPKTVTVNNSFFNGSSGGNGLTVLSKGNVTLNHIYAEANFGNGVSVDNAIYYPASQTYKGSGSVSLLNTAGLNQFLGNNAAAFEVVSKGAITVKGVYAYANHAGLVLDGCALDMNPDPLASHYCLGKGNVTLSAVQVDSANNGQGLLVMAGGAISLDGSRFISNKYGVELRNSVVSAGKAVTVTSSSFFSTFDPASVGLAVYSKGNITLNNVQASFNAGKLTYGPMVQNVSGILLDNCQWNGGLCAGSGTVSVLSSLGPSRAFANNQGDGLFIFSKGAITVSGFSSSNNAGGAYLYNSQGSGAVSITNSIFSYNTWVTGGLSVFSSKAITLTGVEASQNTGGPGAYALNSSGPTTTDAVTISKSHFDHNRGTGLNATAKGNLTLNNVSANLNNLVAGSFGAYLTVINGNLTLKDTLGPNQFSFNSNNGLDAWATNGSISVSGVMASGNTGGSGVVLNNVNAAATKTVTAQRILAEHNGVDGVNVKSKGNVTLNGVQANYNAAGYGVNIDNCGLPAPCEGSGNVSLLATLGPNSASYNKTGMRIDTTGSVVVNGLAASYNTHADSSGVSGLSIYNQHPAAVQKPVTITQSSFDANQGVGLGIWATGVITLNGISASNNEPGIYLTGYGVYLYNYGAPGSPGVNILATLGNNQFNNNTSNGIYIYSGGSIALNKVTANENGWTTTMSGAYLHTINTSSITITCSVFNYNRMYGLDVSMGSGVINFKGVNASNNQSGVGDFRFTSIPAGVTPVVSWTVCGK